MQQPLDATASSSSSKRASSAVTTVCIYTQYLQHEGSCHVAATPGCNCKQQRQHKQYLWHQHTTTLSILSMRIHVMLQQPLMAAAGGKPPMSRATTACKQEELLQHDSSRILKLLLCWRHWRQQQVDQTPKIQAPVTIGWSMSFTIANSYTTPSTSFLSTNGLVHVVTSIRVKQ